MKKDEKKIGLALSGGGYRAAAYHIGALRALHKLGVLDKVDVISSVSGGSIIAAYYALFDGGYEKFEESFRQKIQKGVLTWSLLNLVAVLAIVGLVSWFLGGWGFFGLLVILWFAWYKVIPVSCIIAWEYDKLFFHGKKLSDLPKEPLVTINATDYPTVSQFTFSREMIYNYYYGKGAFYHDYDNQGTHVLTDKMSPYKCEYVIVSDAGNGEVSDKRVYNPLVTLKRTSEVFMQRIKKIQVQQNLYLKSYPNKRFAYAQLEWDVDDRMLQGFVDNLADDNIYPDVIAAHQISPMDIIQLKNSDTTDAARDRIVNQLKKNVRWEELESIRPSEEDHKKAYVTGTWLFGLNKEKIDLLAKEAEWKTALQVRLYLPNLCQI